MLDGDASDRRDNSNSRGSREFRFEIESSRPGELPERRKKLFLLSDRPALGKISARVINHTE